MDRIGQRKQEVGGPGTLLLGDEVVGTAIGGVHLHPEALGVKIHRMGGARLRVVLDDILEAGHGIVREDLPVGRRELREGIHVRVPREDLAEARHGADRHLAGGMRPLEGTQRGREKQQVPEAPCAVDEKGARPGV